MVHAKRYLEGILKSSSVKKRASDGSFAQYCARVAELGGCTVPEALRKAIWWRNQVDHDDYFPTREQAEFTVITILDATATIHVAIGVFRPSSQLVDRVADTIERIATKFVGDATQPDPPEWQDDVRNDEPTTTPPRIEVAPRFLLNAGPTVRTNIIGENRAPQASARERESDAFRRNLAAQNPSGGTARKGLERAEEPTSVSPFSVRRDSTPQIIDVEFEPDDRIARVLHTPLGAEQGRRPPRLNPRLVALAIVFFGVSGIAAKQFFFGADRAAPERPLLRDDNTSEPHPRIPTTPTPTDAPRVPVDESPHGPKRGLGQGKPPRGHHGLTAPAQDKHGKRRDDQQALSVASEVTAPPSSPSPVPDAHLECGEILWACGVPGQLFYVTKQNRLCRQLGDHFVRFGQVLGPKKTAWGWTSVLSFRAGDAQVFDLVPNSNQLVLSGTDPWIPPQVVGWYLPFPSYGY